MQKAQPPLIPRAIPGCSEQGSESHRLRQLKSEKGSGSLDMGWAWCSTGKGHPDPRQAEEEASSATLEELKDHGLVRRLLSPSFRGCLFQVGCLAFTCQLTQRPGMGKGRAREPGVAKALGCCQEAPEALLPTSPGPGFKVSL